MTSRSPSPPPLHRRGRRPLLTTISPYLPAVLLFLCELSELLLVAPRIQLLETALCRRAYPTEPLPLPTELCKSAPVQSSLAHLRAWQVTFDALPVLALAVPWGTLADRVGRKKVLAINLFGCALHILWFMVVCHPGSLMAPEAVWAGALGFALGGGPRTAGVLVLALVGDAASGENRSRRFYYTYAAFLVTELVAPPVSAALVRVGALAPFWAALGALAAAAVVLAAIRAPKIGGHRGGDRGGDEDGTAAEGLLADNGPRKPAASWLSGLRHTPRPVLLVLLGHLLCPVRQELVFQIMIPYASRVFSIPIPRAGLLLSLVALSNLASTVLLLPRLQRHLSRSHQLSPKRIDALSASLSAGVLALGCVLLGFAPSFGTFAVSTAVFAAGFGIRLALLGLLTQLVPEGTVGRWYAVVAVVEGVGEMGSAAALQGVWVLGLRWGGAWTGATWWVGAGAYAGGAWMLGGLGRG
ncbi:major facilitator superfamily domain-containing protein [Geopyxis carbonaria]|nr:major facilitator superfamily domain-containing protein [Geopyxis carbonaria]